ncbi:hypothetical protein GF389_04805 [Candidatus Dojkabacteria bacterium]|nr:hypothetical protein [Candidatus Dojkabacteria bacterium]
MSIPSVIKNQKGITLIEILLYLSISSIVLLSVSVFVTSILKSRVKNESIVLVNEEASQIISQLQTEISQADQINSPVKGTSASSLEFQIAGDPIETISLQTNTVVYTITGNSGIALNSSNTNITSLNFTRMNATNDNESIKVEFTMERNNPNNLNEYDFSKTFYTTVNLPKETGEPETYI